MYGPVVRLNLFGEFQALVGGDMPIELKLKRAKLLLAYLALRPSGRASREELMALLWSERDAAQARQSLRQTLAVIRRSFRPAKVDVLCSDMETVSIDSNAIECDVVSFKRLAKRNALGDLEQAAASYTGELLANLSFHDPIADDWLSESRADLKSTLLRILSSLLAAYIRLEKFDAIEQVASRIIQIDPLDEEAHRALITLFLDRGQQSLAFRQFQLCRRALQRELSVCPAPETEALIRFPARRQNSGTDDIRRAAASLRNKRDQTRAQAPSLIVTPFEVLGDGARADLLAYGLVNDIVVDLSRFSSLFVVPPGLAAKLNLRPLDPVLLGSILEVQYVLAGSVQAIDDHVRIAARLLDARNGHVLWAERYDRQLRDYFPLQDDLARHIVVAASSLAEAADYRRLKQGRRAATNFSAWELCTLAQQAFLSFTPQANAEARSLFARAMSLDPGLARAEVGLAWTHAEDYCFRWTSNPQQSLQKAIVLAHQAAASEPRYYKTRYLLSYLHYFRRQLEEAVDECARGRADNPNDQELSLHEGLLTACLGDGEGGLKRAEEALCLSPIHPDWFHYIYGIIALEAGRYETSCSALSRYINLNNGPFIGIKASALRFRVAAYVLAGHVDAARRDARNYLAVDPDFHVSAFARNVPRKNPVSVDRLASALRSAGLPA